MKYKVAHKSIKGIRPENQDRVLVIEKNNIILATVADGMGGHIGGARAAEIVNNTFKELFKKTNFPKTNHETMTEWLDFASKKAQQNLDDFVKENENYKDMGSTLVAALIIENQIHILNIGDSRGSVFIKGNITQVTKDQNLREHLITTQTINITDYAKNTFSNVLMSSLGPTKKTEKDYYKVNVEEGLIFVLTSDGVHDYIETKKLELILSSKLYDLNSKVDQIIKQALKDESNDNLSIILIKAIK